MSEKLNNNHTNAPWGRENRRQQRRDEAFSRDLTRSGRSAEEQMDLIDSRPGNSRKEMAKLVRGSTSVIHTPDRDLDGY